MQICNVALFFCVPETTYQQIKAKILTLANAFSEGDETTKTALRQTAEFFPVSLNEDEIASGRRSLFIRIRGEMFLVEDTPGGEQDVFAMLLPLM